MRRLAVVLGSLGLCAVSLAATIQQADGKSAEVCEQAVASYGRSEVESGASSLRLCLKSPSGLSRMLQAARTFYSSGQYGVAGKIAHELLKTQPASSEAMYLLGHVYERTKDARESLKWFTNAAAIKRPEAEDLRAVALDYVLLDDYPTAIHWLTRAVSFDPKNAEAWYDLGRAQMTQGNAIAAETALKTSLKLAPRSVKAENNLGVNYEAENRTSDAKQAYFQAIEWQRDATSPSAQPFLNLGTLLVAEHSGRDAIPLLEKAKSIDPGDVRVHEQLGRALDQAGDLLGAVDQMQAAVKLKPESASLHFQLGQLYRRAGRAEDARRELQLSKKLYGTVSAESQP